jgi:plastocyanin
LEKQRSNAFLKKNAWAGIMADKSRAGRHMPFYLVTAALAVVAAAVAQADATSASRGETEPVEVRIVSTEFKFVPATIRVSIGRAVALVLDNTGAETEHGIVVPGFRFRLQAEAGKVVQRTFVFDKAGEFDLLCDLPGHSEAGMRGKLIVR